MTSRIYTAVGEHRRIIRKVTLTETYQGSQHWWVEITPEGYGSHPDAIVFAGYDIGCTTISVKQSEGYGIFRPEYAFRLAEFLTGTKEFVEA